MLFPHGSSYYVAPLAEFNTIISPLHKGENNNLRRLNQEIAEERFSLDRGSSPLTVLFNQAIDSELKDIYSYTLLPFSVRPEIFSYGETSNSWLIKSRFFYLRKDHFNFYDYKAKTEKTMPGIGYHRCYVDQELRKEASLCFISGYTHDKIKTNSCLSKQFKFQNFSQQPIEIFLFFDEHLEVGIPDQCYQSLTQYLDHYCRNEIKEETIKTAFYYFYQQVIVSSNLQSLPGFITLINGDDVWTATWGGKKMLNIIFSPDNVDFCPEVAQEQLFFEYAGLQLFFRCKRAKSYLVLGSKEIFEKMTISPLLDLINELFDPDEKLTPSKIVAELLASLANYEIFQTKVVLVPLESTSQELFKKEFNDHSLKINKGRGDKLILPINQFAKRFDNRQSYMLSNDILVENLARHIGETLGQSAAVSSYPRHSVHPLEKFLKRGGKLEFIAPTESPKLILSKLTDQWVYVGCDQALNRSPTFGQFLSCQGFNVKGILAGFGMDLLCCSQKAFEICNTFIQSRSPEENNIFQALFGTPKPDAVHPSYSDSAIEQRAFYLKYFKKVAYEAIEQQAKVTFLGFGSSFNGFLLHLLELGLKDFSQFKIVALSFPDTITNPNLDPRFAASFQSHIKGLSLDAHRNFISLMQSRLIIN